MHRLAACVAVSDLVGRFGLRTFDGGRRRNAGFLRRLGMGGRTGPQEREKTQENRMWHRRSPVRENRWCRLCTIPRQG